MAVNSEWNLVLMGTELSQPHRKREREWEMTGLPLIFCSLVLGMDKINNYTIHQLDANFVGTTHAQLKCLLSTILRSRSSVNPSLVFCSPGLSFSTTLFRRTHNFWLCEQTGRGCREEAFRADSIFFLLLAFKTGYCYTALLCCFAAMFGLEPIVLLPQFLQCWSYMAYTREFVTHL